MAVSEVSLQARAPHGRETASAPDGEGWGAGKIGETVRGGRLLDALRGVPKSALRTVLGKELGSRAWREARGGTASGMAQGVSDWEIMEGLIGHLSRTAARTLREEGRMARSVRLYATYADGRVSGGWRRLNGITQEAAEIFEESRSVYESLAKGTAQVVNLELRVGSVAAEVDAERARPRFGMAEAIGAV